MILTAYLMLRSSKTQSLQQIADKIIEVGGSATASASGNGLTLQISAKKEKFEEFFQYVVDVLKTPAFEQSQFDLIKSQTLSSLDRPYTEPDTVSSLTMARTIEIYQPGDLSSISSQNWPKNSIRKRLANRLWHCISSF